MKKSVAILIILISFSVSLSAENIAIFQGTYLNTSRNYEISSTKITKNFHEAGINLSYFIGKKLGFFVSSNFTIPFSGTIKALDNKVKFSMDNYIIGFGVDALIGLGYNIKVNKYITIIPAIGPHTNTFMFSPKEGNLPLISATLGAGAALNVLFHVDEQFSLNIGGQFAYDFFEYLSIPVLLPNDNKKGGITYSVSIGLGFRP